MLEFKTIDLSVMEASKSFRQLYSLAVYECLKFRKKRKHTLLLLSDELAIPRQKLSKFEKLQIYDTVILSNILEYYSMELVLSIDNLR